MSTSYNCLIINNSWVHIPSICVGTHYANAFIHCAYYKALNQEKNAKGHVSLGPLSFPTHRQDLCLLSHSLSVPGYSLESHLHGMTFCVRLQTDRQT